MTDDPRLDCHLQGCSEEYIATEATLVEKNNELIAEVGLLEEISNDCSGKGNLL